MDKIQLYLNQIKVPTATQNIYKDECMFSFDNAETETGIYVSLKSFLCFGEAFVEKYVEKSGNHVFLHIHRLKMEIPKDNDASSDSQPEPKITRLAIGVEGGFQSQESQKKFVYTDIYKVVIFPSKESIPYPDTNLPLLVQQSVEAVIKAESLYNRIEKESLTGTWDGEVRVVSKHAENLSQLDNNKTIPPSGWKCEKCDLTINLWLNLTDGTICCGRSFFDGSGGNNHAVEHYKETNYPLAVKLGTISSDGKADVYSYAEDDMVIDPKLADHLAHFGIKIQLMEKCEKSMVELEIDMNKRIGEWSTLTESESKLIPLSGPGYTGMKNLGNSCYMNSVMQVLFTIPDFIETYVDKAHKYFESFSDNAPNDFNIQMAKLGTGLCSGKYSVLAENYLDSESDGISPVMFKNLIGKNHPDFGTKQQQDALDFVLHIATFIERNCRKDGSNNENPMNAFKFCIEDRVECMASHKVKYTKREECCLSLSIPMDKTTNIDELKDYLEEVKIDKSKENNPVRPRISIQSILETFSQDEIIEQYYSTVIKSKTTAKKCSKISSMPEFLILHFKKFTLRNDWVPIKLDIAIDNVDELDLSNLRSSGQKPGEEILPEIDSEPPAPVLDETIINELAIMGFPIEACKKAVFNTKNSNLEQATEWIMQHITDADFNDPFIPPGTKIPNSSGKFVADPESLTMLMSMGFDQKQATKALKETNNNVERATDWIFSHVDELADMDVDEQAPSVASSNEPKYRDGSSKYKLVAFISHMGSSSHVGHYVCHILKDGKWVIFNDSKVAISQKPPKDLGYLYFYKREN